MSFSNSRELIATVNSKFAAALGRIDEDSIDVLVQLTKENVDYYKELLSYYIDLIPEYFLEGMTSCDCFLDRKSLDSIAEKLNTIKFLRIIPHTMDENVQCRQGMFMITEFPKRYSGFSSIDTLTLDFLSEFGQELIQYDIGDIDKLVKTIKDYMDDNNLFFDPIGFKEGIKAIIGGIAEANAMRFFLDKKHMSRCPFVFILPDYVCLFAKTLSFIGNISDDAAMGKLSINAFSGNLLKTLEEEIKLHPKELVLMISILGDLYSSLYGDRKNITELLNYYLMLCSILDSIDLEYGDVLVYE